MVTAGRRSTIWSISPLRQKWTCQSMKPGNTCRAPQIDGVCAILKASRFVGRADER